ncbi:hypothetical protein BGZ51_000565 [Haplosporangium sp. Z 767]|nr:hypothetical protein BGZ51_000565 [Haplosporangium sp. Z 767]KAF9194064.1 hypothetical protein BGZ50_006729 [Haplosporangium sp. Z 11]
MFRGASFLLFLNWVCIVVWLISSFESTDATIVVLATNDTYVDRTAAFGPRIPEDGITLNLIAVETLNGSDQSGCRRVAGAPPDLPWVALVERGGDCSFVDKVRNMQASGAKAVIVGDNQKSGLITMYARENTDDVLIPSVFIAQQHYRELRYLGMEFGNKFLVKMTPDDMNWPVLDVIIFIILSPAFVILFLYFLWRIRLRQQLIADLAPTEVVDNLPIKVFYASKLQENDPVECVICLEEFEDEAELRVLPCRHEYHVACIDNWLTTRKKFCPICKRDICTATESTPLLRSSTDNETRPESYNSIPSNNSSPTAVSAASSSASTSDESSGSSGSRAQQPPRSGRSNRSTARVRPAISDVVVPIPARALSSSTTPPQPDSNTEQDVLRRM